MRRAMNYIVVIILMLQYNPVFGDEVNNILNEVKTNAEAVEKGEKSLPLLQTSAISRFHKIVDYKKTVFFILSLLFGVIFISILILFHLNNSLFSEKDTLIHILGLVLLVYGAITITIISETSDQLSASIGILGAIAGYLFGTMKKPTQ